MVDCFFVAPSIKTKYSASIKAKEFSKHQDRKFRKHQDPSILQASRPSIQAYKNKRGTGIVPRLLNPFV